MMSIIIRVLLLASILTNSFILRFFCQAQVGPPPVCFNTGLNCLDDCSSNTGSSGDYQWCGACTWYLTCVGTTTFYTPCSVNLNWDDEANICQAESSTCQECMTDTTPFESTATIPLATPPVPAICESTGPECIDTCDLTQNGIFQWCARCDYFLFCSETENRYIPCVPGFVYDDVNKTCIYVSSTCTQCYDETQTTTSIYINEETTSEPSQTTSDTMQTTTNSIETSTSQPEITTETIMFDPCLSNPCRNGATCQPLLGSDFTCNCDVGWTDALCETPLNLILSITSHESLSLTYIDGVKYDLQNGNIWNVTDNIIIPSDGRLVAVQAVSTTDICTGLIGSVTGNYLVSDSSWKCSQYGAEDWYELGFDDSSWPHAALAGLNGNFSGCPSITFIPAISASAYWIWTELEVVLDRVDRVVFCRATLPLCEINSPCLNGGTCIYNSRDVCECIPFIWTGRYCEKEWTPCVDEPCLNNGTCSITGDRTYNCTCTPEYTGKNCQILIVNRTLSITVKTTLYDLYIDGVKRNTTFGNNWTLVDEIELAPFSRLISVMAIDSTELCAGILASVTDDFLVTDVTWRCSYVVPPQWYILGYDDSVSPWEDAYAIGPNDNVTFPDQCKNLTEISSISLNASWIWLSDILDTPAFSRTVYCRAYLPMCERELPCQNGGSCNKNSPFICTCLAGYIGQYCESVEEVLVTLTAQEVLYAAYVDGVQVDLRHGVIAAETDNVTVWSISRLIAVMAIQLNPDCPGILVSVTNGTLDYVLSSATWKCSSTANVGWYNLGFNDSNWANATSIQQNIDSNETAACPNLPIVPDISENAYWIWTGPSASHTLVSFCRGYIPTCARDPCKNGICNVNSNVLCTCDPDYQGLHCDELIPTTTSSAENSFKRKI